MDIPVTYDFPIHYQNDGLNEFTITLVYDSDDTPVDLTGAKIKMDLRPSIGASPVWTFSNENGSLVVLPNGVIRFSEINSWSIPAGKYLYDLQLTDSTGFVRTYIKGTWSIMADITR